MSDGIERWSLLVRTPGTVRIHAHHETQIPAEGEGLVVEKSRPGLRLMVHPVATPRPVYLIDVSSTAVQAMLEGFLRTGASVGKELSWQARGFGTRRRDTIHLKSRPE